MIITSPWTRGPLLLLNERMAAMAVLVAALVLGLVVAAGPLFVSSVGTAALHSAAAEQCVQDNQISLVNPQSFPRWENFVADQGYPAIVAADPVVRRAFARESLPAPVLSTYTAIPTGLGSVGNPDRLGLFSAPGALNEVTLLNRVPGPGIYLTDTYAAAHKLHAGDELSLPSGRLRIAGIYRDLDTASFRTVLPEFWCHWRDLIVTSVSNLPPPFVLADPSIIAARSTTIVAEWTSPIDIDALTVAEATSVAAAGRRLLGSGRPDPVGQSIALAGYTEHTDLDFNLARTGKVRDAVGTPVLVIAAAGGLLALVLLAAAVLLWGQRRRAELTLLSARGVGPVPLGVKAVAELGLPAAVGCLTGWAAGLGLVPLLGPSPLTEPGAPSGALIAVGGAWSVALVIMLVVAAITVSEHRLRGARTLRLAPALAVIGLLAAAAVLFARADLHRLILPGVYRIDPALLLAPILGLAGAVLAAALLAVASLGRARAAANRCGFAVFAAVHRAAAARGTLVMVICGLAIPVGLAGFSAGFTASASATVTAKAETYAGAPVALDLHVVVGAVPDLGEAATPVSYALGRASGTRDPSASAAGDNGSEVELLGVDPRTLAAYAYTDPDITGTPLRDLLPRLTMPALDGTTSALLVGDWTGPTPRAVQVRSSVLAISVVDRIPAFPGIRYPYQPTIVVNVAAIAGMDSFANWHNELWTDRAHASDVLAALERRGIFVDDVLQPDTLLDNTNLLPLTWTFDFLQAVSILIAVISVAGLLSFLAARQHRQEAAYILMRRIGMTRRTYLRSLLLELGGLTGWAWASGAVTGTLALLLATVTIDVNPGFLPPTLLRLPVATLVGTGVGLAVVTAGLASWTRWRADRADAVLVLRTNAGRG